MRLLVAEQTLELSGARAGVMWCYLAGGFGFTLFPYLKVYHGEKEQREAEPSWNIPPWFQGASLWWILKIHSTDV